MKKTATITINDKIITINEITVRQMISIKDKIGSANILDAIEELLPMLTDVSSDFLLELAPSELEEIYEKVKEVNGSFFRLLPLEKLLAGYREMVMETITSKLSGLSVVSLQPVMDLPPGTMAGDYL